jgi:hypothetical protein
MYARQPRQQFGYPRTAGPYLHRPSFHPYGPYGYETASYGYERSPYYAYEDDLYVQEPSELEALELEEQRLLQEQAAILAERRRLAAEKRRIQLAEQERIRNWEMEQAYLEQRRRQQQQIQQQQQIRQRQLAAQKEAQLEAALRELEYGNGGSPYATVCHHGAQSQARRASQKTAPQPTSKATSSPHQHPLEWFFQALGQDSAKPVQSARRAAPSNHPQAKQAKAAVTPSSSSSSSSSKIASSPVREAPKRVAVDPLQALKQRISEADKHVSDLLSTPFDRLSLRQLGSIDNELMQILIGLDNINADTESARNERKSLINKTVALADQVDQFKEKFSRASSETSSATSNTQTEAASEHMAVDHPAEDEPVEDIDADSNASDVEPSDPFATQSITINSAPSASTEAMQLSHEQTEVKEASSAAMEVSLEAEVQNHEGAANDDEVVAWDDHEEDTTPADESKLESAPSTDSQVTSAVELMQVDEKDSEQPTTSSEPLNDPFGFNIIHEAAKKSTNDVNEQSHSSVPIQIGNNRKSSVLIEPVH